MNRRELFRYSAMAASLPLMAGTRLTAAQSSTSNPLLTKSNQLGWLDTAEPRARCGYTWGQPWPQGRLKTNDALHLVDQAGKYQPLQTWVMATWPDGSVKWTGHATAAGQALGQTFHIEKSELKGRAPKAKHSVTIGESGKKLLIDTGVIRCVVNTQGEVIIDEITRAKKTLLQNAQFIGQRQNQTEADGEQPLQVEHFSAQIQQADIEQRGPLRAVVKLSGMHRTANGREWLPFSLRLYFHAGGDAVRISHSFIFDGDEQQDFIRALGLRFDVLQRDETYNRHVRFVGEGNGLWAESPQGITGLRRDPGKAVREAQINGVATPALNTWDKRVSERLQFIPVWNDYSLSQVNANGFSIKKRTKAGHAWIDVDQGKRASGVAYVGGASGGVLFGMRDFWQLHPTQIDIRNAGTPTAQATMWIWSPDAPPMDLRFYHDGMGMDTYAKQIEGLEITYEDYEPGFGSPQGIARTTDMMLYALDATPSREQCIDLADSIRTPAQIIAAPQTYLDAGVFGGLWSLPDRSTPIKKIVEDRLDWSIDFYQQQIDQRHWYGFWNYGDVMHTYDTDRHVWRYDVGGFAWDNSELSPDLWLWYSFLRSGDARAFRIAEAMTRHTRDVDIYHLGRFAGLGTRHNVQHWGCSAKQLRISTAAYRRFHYFLTGDERTGDVLWEVAEADKQLVNLLPTRKVNPEAAADKNTHIGIGTDWGSAAANWLTAWERTGDARYKTWLENAMRTIGGNDLGFFAKGYHFDINSKAMTVIPADPLESGRPKRVSHLNAVFGLIEICAELNQLIDVLEFKAAWLRYGRFYSAPAAQQAAEFGVSLTGNNLTNAHSRLTAYVAQQTGDTALAKRAWDEFFREANHVPEVKRVEGPLVLNPVDEAAWVSTNDSAQWGLAAIQNLALIGSSLAGSALKK
ncbi:exo-rhamnogalacturonan lyase family protein [Cellvibrio sp. QJXJ]|uniref:exo-rhamnogalacturonan lyase family protein n=1 Tax=Cellvibrio sp. QJXJ TaxID=2964606 RepID=UPI0021C32E32|nr:Tat pathway signal sequence domain protein [Cellvibrio sp. QJXJ]UUA74194.1 Tat pathway signal sequence domain protein [Cellvibrio sp. QJXJ]